MANPTRHYDKWQIRWMDSNGRRKSKTYASFNEAKLAQSRFETQADEIRTGLKSPFIEGKTFDDLASYWIEHRASQKRSDHADRSMIKRHLLPALGGRMLTSLTVQDMDTLKIIALSRLSPKTQHNILTLLISLLNTAKDLRWMTEVPIIKKPRITLDSQDYRYFKKRADLQRFLDAAKKKGESVYAIYATALYTGMRAGELAGLQWADIDLEHRVITVQRSYEGPTKSAKIRRIPILDTLLVILRQWRIQTQTIWVFPNQKGTHHQPSAQIFQEIFQKILAQAGFKKILVKGKQRHYLRFHDLRHTFASQWMMSGGDLFKLQRILGHQSIAMTQRYSHLSPSAFESDYSRLGTPMPCLAPVLSIHSNGQVHSSVNESAPLSLHPIQEVESL